MSEAASVKWSEGLDPKEWDDFVAKNGGSVFHLWSWRKVLEDDETKALYLVCRDSAGEMLAVCPFFFRSGRRLLYVDSLPDSYTAGPIISPRVKSPSQIVKSLRGSVSFSRIRPTGAMVVKTHQERVIESIRELGSKQEAAHVLFLLDLEKTTPEHVWSHGFQKHDRQAVKYYEASASFAFASDAGRYVTLERPGWDMYKFQKLKLFRPEFIARMQALLQDRLKIAEVVDPGGKPLAGLLMLLDPEDSPKPTVHLLAIRHNPSNNIHSVVTYIDWKALCWARDHGFKEVDFGPYPISLTSDPSHPYHKFVKRFEVTPSPRYVFYIPVSGVSYSLARVIGKIF